MARGAVSETATIGGSGSICAVGDINEVSAAAAADAASNRTAIEGGTGLPNVNGVGAVSEIANKGGSGVHSAVNVSAGAMSTAERATRDIATGNILTDVTVRAAAAAGGCSTSIDVTGADKMVASNKTATLE